MTILYFILDICFYNFTSFKTHLLLLSFLEKKKENLFHFLEFLFIEIILQTHGKLLFILILLFFFNKKLKIPNTSVFAYTKRFFLLFLLYQILTFLFFQKFVFSLSGIMISLFFLIISYKNPFQT